jgi:hypothetical protein
MLNPQVVRRGSMIGMWTALWLLRSERSFSFLFRLCVIQFGISHLERWSFSIEGSIYVAHHQLTVVPAFRYHLLP